MTTPASPPSLTVTRRGPALVVRLGDGTRANALNEATLAALTSLLNGPRVAEAAAVLLSGSGERHFSAGLDLGAAGAGEDDPPADRLRRGEELLFAASEAIVACRRPVIAVLNGTVVGGGLELALACDWRIAHRGVRLAMPATRLGVIYRPAGLRRALALLGPARTRRIFLTGQPIGAEEALELGLVDHLVEPDDLWPAAEAAAQQVAAGSAQAVEGTRALIRALEEPMAAEALEREADRWRRAAFDGPDFREGMRAFAERRPPRFADPA